MVNPNLMQGQINQNNPRMALPQMSQNRPNIMQNNIQQPMNPNIQTIQSSMIPQQQQSQQIQPQQQSSVPPPPYPEPPPPYPGQSLTGQSQVNDKKLINAYNLV
jgi:hypothetical protein